MKLSDLVQSFYDANVLTTSDMSIRRRVCKELKLVLSPRYPKLVMFGSSANGFGMKESDIDVYLNGTESSMEEIRHSLISIEEILKHSTALFDGIVLINSKKIPIIRLRHQVTKLIVDLSLNKKTSVSNTLLLRAYTEIDPRVSVLGCFLKALAKSVDIARPAKQSLSSFGYCVMMVHFLQNRLEPVLPVFEPDLFTDVNTAYTINVDRLSLEWPEYGRNSESVGRLWLGFLNYFSNFDFDKYVITISHMEPMEKSKHHCWQDVAGIAIQNPFEPNQNVAHNVFDEMSDHIIKTIHHWEKYFLNNKNFDAQSVFDGHALKYGSAPVNKFCFICGEKGHIAMNCGMDEFDVNSW